MKGRATRLAQALALLVVVLTACDLPRDPDGSLERARGGTLRVGAAHNPPWVSIGSGEPEGVEVTLVNEIARAAGARIEWHPGAESELLTALKDREIDIVVAGLTDDLPWIAEVGFTRVYYEDPVAKKKHVMAVAPGENALLVHVERVLLREKSAVPNLLRHQSP